MHQVPGSTGTTHGISSHGLALGFPNGSFRTSAWDWRVRCTVAPVATRRWNDVAVNKGGARQGWTRQIPYRLMIRSADHWTPACVPVDIRPPACRRSPGRTKSMEAILRVAQLKDEPRQARSAQQMPMRPGSGRLAKCRVCSCSAAHQMLRSMLNMGHRPGPSRSLTLLADACESNWCAVTPAVSMYAGAMVRIQVQWPPMDADDLHSPRAPGRRGRVRRYLAPCSNSAMALGTCGQAKGSNVGPWLLSLAVRMVRQNELTVRCSFSCTERPSGSRIWPVIVDSR